MNKTTFTYSTAILITMIVLIYYYLNALQPTSYIQEGSVDLSQTDFNEHEVIALDGEWEFYWNQFLNPDDFTGSAQQNAAQHDEARRDPRYLNVPGNWLLDTDGNTYAPKGYATFRVVIEHIPDEKFFGLKKANIRNASRVYVNGELLVDDGQISKTLEGSVAGNNPKVVYFELEDSTAEIIVQAANHEYILGGIAKPILFGTQDGLMQLQNRRIVFEFAMILIVVIIGLFYLLLFLGNKHYRRKEPVTLPLALSCLSFGIMNSIYSERIITVFNPEITLNLTFRFGHFMSAFSIIMVWLVINKVSTVLVSNTARNALLVFYGVFMVFVLTLPLEIYLSTLTFYMIATVILYFIVWARLLVLFFKKRTGSDTIEHRTLIVAIFAIFIFWLDLTLYSLGIKVDMFVSFLAISVYSIALALLLIVRYANSYKKNEELSIQLIETFSTLDQTTKEAQRNELAFLQAQIKPHFLFNALSSIISLCYTNGERAGKLLSDLTNYLKRSFQIDVNADFVTIENELRLIKAFVDIEKVRFEERVNVVFDIDDDVLSYKIIPLVIEPLVENAIRHGVLKNKSGGKVKVTIKKLKHDIKISVVDNGKGVAAQQLEQIQLQEKDRLEPEGHGVSLININARLHNFYGTQLYFDTNDKGTKVYFSIPLQQVKEA